MRNKLALMLAVAGFAALVSANTALAAWQDTNLCDVPTADFPTIQSAADETLCFTIRLRIQTYTEQVTIRRSLTLTGQSLEQNGDTFMSTLRAPADMVSPALIEVVGPRTRLKIKRLIIEGPSTGAGLIGIRAARDTRVTIRDCAFRDIRPPEPTGQWDHIAMHVGGPLQPKTKVGITGHSVTNCTFERYQNAAILIEGVGTTALIEHNLLEADDPATLRPAGTSAPIGVFGFDGASVTIDRNNIRGHSHVSRGSAAIFLSRVASDSVVSFNNIDQNDLGIGLDGANGLKIYRNGLVQNVWGMTLGGSAASDSNTIQSNRIEKGGIALVLWNASENNISSNELVINSSGHGAILSAAALKNRLYDNRSDNNGGWGFLDWSVGRSTGGTANTYTSNICSGNNAGGQQSAPVGLCR